MRIPKRKQEQASRYCLDRLPSMQLHTQERSAKYKQQHTRRTESKSMRFLGHRRISQCVAGGSPTYNSSPRKCATGSFHASRLRGPRSTTALSAVETRRNRRGLIAPQAAPPLCFTPLIQSRLLPSSINDPFGKGLQATKD